MKRKITSKLYEWKKTSKELYHYLNNSYFHELMKTGHEANIEAPEELANVLQRFYDRDGSKIISDGALVAITLMIAESRPEEKDIMVNLVMNFLTM